MGCGARELRSWKARAVVSYAFALLLIGHAAHAASQTTDGAPGSRVALIIGISDYSVSAYKLDNPVRDASFVADALRGQHFEVQAVMNPTRQQLVQALGEFSNKADHAEAAIIYYAGHGVEVDGVNYLLPADIRPLNQDAGQGAASAEPTRAMKAMFTETALKAAIVREALVGPTKVRLLILDACREDPFAGQASRGLARRGGGLARESDGAATEVVTLMAAAPGKVAYDGGPSHHSPFAEALVAALKQPGMIIGDLPYSVQTRVEELTSGEGAPQSPDQQGIFRDTRWSFGSMTSMASGSGAPGSGASVSGAASAEAVAEQRLAREKAFWLTAKDSDDPADLQAYLDRVDSGEFSGLFKPLALNRIRALRKAAAAKAVVSEPPATQTIQKSQMAMAREAYARSDFQAAAEAWTQAARQGSGLAMYNLGILALNGRGMPKDLAAAAGWFKSAAAAGNLAGMSNYAICVINGYGVPKDASAGVSWLRRAADGGLPSAMALMAKVYRNGIGVAPDVPTAIDWLRKAVDAGDGPALVALGEAYAQGVGVKADTSRAFELYRRAALAGQPDGMVRVGYFYEEGVLGPPDPLQAATWYQRAADAGDAEGMSALAVLLETGRGIGKDEEAAARYYRMAADRNDPRGLLGMGDLYARAGAPHNDALAVDYFRRASDLGETTAMRNLALMYELGRGAPRDTAAALRLYRKALAAGDEAAAEGVQRLSSN